MDSLVQYTRWNISASIQAENASAFTSADAADVAVWSVHLGVIQEYGTCLPLLQTADRNNVEKRRGLRQRKENRERLGF